MNRERKDIKIKCKSRAGSRALKKKNDFCKKHVSDSLEQRICVATGQNDPLQAIFLILGTKNNLYGFVEEDILEYVITTFEALKPADMIEASLVQQFIILHHQGVHRMCQAKKSEYIENSNQQINMATKLLRLAQETIATLLKYRNKGQQQVFVTNVDKGGKAIIGNVSTGGG